MDSKVIDELVTLRARVRELEKERDGLKSTVEALADAQGKWEYLAQTMAKERDEFRAKIQEAEKERDEARRCYVCQAGEGAMHSNDCLRGALAATERRLKEKDKALREARAVLGYYRHDPNPGMCEVDGPCPDCDARRFCEKYDAALTP
jgi:chromosome segregation ATPase